MLSLGKYQWYLLGNITDEPKSFLKEVQECPLRTANFVGFNPVGDDINLLTMKYPSTYVSTLDYERQQDASDTQNTLNNL